MADADPRPHRARRLARAGAEDAVLAGVLRGGGAGDRGQARVVEGDRGDVELQQRVAGGDDRLAGARGPGGQGGQARQLYDQALAEKAAAASPQLRLMLKSQRDSLGP